MADNEYTIKFQEALRKLNKAVDNGKVEWEQADAMEIVLSKAVARLMQDVTAFSIEAKNRGTIEKQDRHSVLLQDKSLLSEYDSSIKRTMQQCNIAMADISNVLGESQQILFEKMEEKSNASNYKDAVRFGAVSQR